MKLRTLVVEDEWATRNYLVEMLQASGVAEIVGAVANAESARQALVRAYAVPRASDELHVDEREIDLSLSAVESSVGRTLLRAHRSWLVNVPHVKELEGHGSEMELLVGGGVDQDGVRIPVSRDRAQAVREALLASTMGLRPR